MSIPENIPDPELVERIIKRQAACSLSHSLS